MSSYLVFSEEWYGGGEMKLAIFNSSSEAKNYIDTNIDDMNFMCKEIPSFSNYWIVVTEDYYGGGPDLIGVFSSEFEAQEYKDKLEEELDLDILVISLRQVH